MRKLFFACALLLSFSVFVGCDKDDDDEPGNGGGSTSVNVSAGNVQLGDDSFKAKYAYVIYGEKIGDEGWNQYVFADKDLLKYAERGEDIDDIDEDFSTVYIDYDTRHKSVDDVYIEYKYNGYRGTGFEFEYDEYKYDTIEDYVSIAISGKKVKATAKSFPMIRYNVRTGNEVDVKVSFNLEATPTDVSYLEDYDDYDYTRASIEVKEVSDPKQVAFLTSLRHKKAH